MFGCFTLRVMFGGAMWVWGRAFVRQTRRFEAEDAKNRTMSLLIARLILYLS
jgi:hypothetical protein